MIDRAYFSIIAKKAAVSFTMFIMLVLLFLNRSAFGDLEVISNWETGLGHFKDPGADRALIFIAHGKMDGIMNLATVAYDRQPMTKILTITLLQQSRLMRWHISSMSRSIDMCFERYDEILVRYYEDKVEIV